MPYEVKNVTSFPCRHQSLTPNDTTEFHNLMTILVMNAGNVAVADKDGTVITYTNVPAFTTLPVLCSKLMLTNTTATGFVGLYGDL